MVTVIEENEIKKLMKETFAEVIQEKPAIYSALIAEAIEDIALARAIKEGEDSKTINKEEVYDILKG